MIRLLLVEDDANLSYMIQAALEDMIGDYEVTIANNGQEGLEAYRQDKPDVIVADIEMPVMDGYEMVRRIRETDREIPILFSSARVSPKDVVKGYELGVNNYVKKPFLPERPCFAPHDTGNNRKKHSTDFYRRRLHLRACPGKTASYFRQRPVAYPT